jgi:hypothetical protein
MKRPFEAYFIYVLLGFLSFCALYGGVSLIISPDGSLLSMNPEWITDTPFQNYLIPGILLFSFLGIMPALTLTGMLTKKNIKLLQSLNIFHDKFWAWSFALYSGIISLIWIIVQQLITDFFILQLVISAVGLLIVIFILLPGIQKYYSI